MTSKKPSTFKNSKKESDETYKSHLPYYEYSISVLKNKGMVFEDCCKRDMTMKVEIIVIPLMYSESVIKSFGTYRRAKLHPRIDKFLDSLTEETFAAIPLHVTPPPSLAETLKEKKSDVGKIGSESDMDADPGKPLKIKCELLLTP